MKRTGKSPGAGSSVRAVLCALCLLVLLPFCGCTVMSIMAFSYDKAEAGDVAEGAPLGADPLGIGVQDPQVTLAWSPPPSEVDGYKLLIRVHGTEDWYVLADAIAAAADPQHTVLHSDPAVGDGDFDFGVVAVKGEESSVMHISLDVTAQPDSGWYLSWDF